MLLGAGSSGLVQGAEGGSEAHQYSVIDKQ